MTSLLNSGAPHPHARASDQGHLALGRAASHACPNSGTSASLERENAVLMDSSRVTAAPGLVHLGAVQALISATLRT
jgi:hypothetical protein